MSGRCEFTDSVSLRHATQAAVAAALAVAVAGCTIGPDFERPQDLPAQEQYRGVLEPQDAASFADLAWADVFNDPDLRAVIEAALQGNLDLRIAAERVEEFRAHVRVSRSLFGPEIRATGSTSPAPDTPEDSSYSLGLSLNWEIDLFGKLRRANEATRAQLLAVEDFQRGVVTTLVADVASTWFALREIDEEIAIIERTIASQQASLDLVRSQKANGIASGTEEQQALSQLASTRSQLPRAEQRRVQAENLLRYLVGDVPGPVQRATTHQPYLQPQTLPVGLPAQLLARRPDLRQLENELHAATANVGVAEASRFPYLSIGLTSFFGLISPELGSLLNGNDPATKLFSVGPFIDMPVFQSGGGIANVDVAKSQLVQSELAYRRGVLNAYREVADALVVTDKIRAVIDDSVIGRDSARKVLDLQRKRYRAGVVSYLEILDADRTLFAAEVDLARSQLSQNQAYVELYRALGGGWK